MERLEQVGEKDYSEKEQPSREKVVAIREYGEKRTQEWKDAGEGVREEKATPGESFDTGYQNLKDYLQRIDGLMQLSHGLSPSRLMKILMQSRNMMKILRHSSAGS